MGCSLLCRYQDGLLVGVRRHILRINTFPHRQPIFVNLGLLKRQNANRISTIRRRGTAIPF